MSDVGTVTDSGMTQLSCHIASELRLHKSRGVLLEAEIDGPKNHESEIIFEVSPMVKVWVPLKLPSENRLPITDTNIFFTDATIEVPLASMQ